MASVRAPLEVVLIEPPSARGPDRPDFATVLATAWPGPVRVQRADRLADALALVAASRPDCIVVDTALPDAAGLGAVLKLRSSEPQVPIVVLSDLDDDHLGAEAVHAGAQDYLSRASADATAIVRSIRYAIVRGRIDARHVDEARVLELVARGSAVQPVLQDVAEFVERHATDVLCGIYLTDGATLRVGAAPSLPPTYRESVEGLAIGPGAGPGACAFRRQPIQAPDLALDPSWEGNRVAALAHGLRAAWSNPILASDGRQVLGVMTLYSRLPRRPDLDDQRLLDQAVNLASIALERSQIQSQLAHAALHDPLTSLPNRSLFMDRLALALARARRPPSGAATGPLAAPSPTVAVLFIDMDHFKDINDTLGHEAGDELLICAADRLRRIVRPSDTVSRFGGDEFMVLCDGLGDPRDAERVAGRVASAFQAPYSIGDQQVSVGASIGVALAGAELSAPDELIRAADLAMYRAKERGRNRYELAGATADVPQRHVAEQELRQALQLSVGHPATADRPGDVEQRLTLLFQRIIGVADGALVGVEALVRWLHPQRGVLLPDDFQTIAETSELIVPIDHWVLRETLRLLEVWQAERGHSGVTACVNLSERSLLQFDLPAVVSDSLECARLEPSILCLEVAERSLVKASEATSANLRELHRMGVRIAVDGYGESLSLAALGDLPIDAVKINVGASDARLLGAAVQAARSYDLVVIAQGVETAQHLARVRQLGCDCVQGRYLGRPELVSDTIDLVGFGSGTSAAVRV
jgi:diguanylate cyclase (GGDEF)-like protein